MISDGQDWSGMKVYFFLCTQTLGARDIEPNSDSSVGPDVEGSFGPYRQVCSYIIDHEDGTGLG